VLIGRVIGDVVATQKSPSHQGRKILVVQPLNLDGSDRGEVVLALDAVDAGIGDRVLIVTEGFSAMTAVGRPNSPIDMAIVGVIDSVDLIDGVKRKHGIAAIRAIEVERLDDENLAPFVRGRFLCGDNVTDDAAN